MKTVISSRYYPTLYGRKNTRYSYRGYYVGSEPAKGTSDYIAGYCSTTESDGWVPGVRGGVARGKYSAVRALNGFVEKEQP